jgi:adenylosuccinate lyase
LGLSARELEGVLDDPLSFTGNAADQIARFTTDVAKLADRFPEAVAYRPAPIL